MTLVDHDDGKGVLRVMLPQKTRIPVLIIIESKRLVRGDMNLRIPGGVFTALILYKPDATLRERSRQLVVGLFTQFVPVTEK